MPSVLLVYSDVRAHPSFRTQYLIANLLSPWLYTVKALAELRELPKRCYSGPNADFIALGREVCGVVTAMGVFSLLGVFTSMFLLTPSLSHTSYP